MAIEPKPYEEKHLARNVPRDFNAILERQRHALIGDGELPTRVLHRFKDILKELSPDEFDETSQSTLFNRLLDIRLRYLVLSKTLDQSVPPTPIMDALRSVKNRTRAAVRELNDDDRDEQVRELAGIEDISSGLAAFEKANTLAERAAIAAATVRQFDSILTEMAEFFDYKAGMMPRGNQTKFGLIYAINALAETFETWNSFDRNATINKSIIGRGDSERMGEAGYTGPFIKFIEGFFRWADDSQLDWRGETLRDRIRRLTIERKKDPDLHRLLDGVVEVSALLEFMKRAEAVRS